MRRLLFALALFLSVASTWIGLTRGQIVPVQRNLLYVHVPSSVCALLCFVVLLAAGISVLVAGRDGKRGHSPFSSGNRTPGAGEGEEAGCPLFRSWQVWDLAAVAAAEVGLVFATILNATGMIFSRAEWNVWWTPSPRLVTSALLWFLYAVYLILRISLPGAPQRRARICAVFGIVAFLDVPLVFISARFIADIHRPSFSLASAWQTAALMSGMAATVHLAAALIWLRTDLLRLELTVDRG